MNDLSFDVGYIDNPGSVHIRVDSTNGSSILIANSIGINHITTNIREITGISVEEVSTEEAGFAIDNLAFASGGAPTAACAPAAFLAVAGSGQHWNRNDPNDLSISPQLQYLYDSMLERSDGIRPIKHVVRYPAASVDELTEGLPDDAKYAMFWGPALGLKHAVEDIKDRAKTYLGASKDIGVSQLRAEFATIRRECPSERIILGGYSQGAMVVHEFLNELAQFGNTASKHAVLNAVLIADPERVKHSEVLELEDAPWSGYGVCDIAAAVLRIWCTSSGSLTDVIPAMRSRTVSVCSHDDPVCDTSDLFGDLVLEAAAGYLNNAVTLAKRAPSIHESYRYSTGTRAAGRLIGIRLASQK